MLESGDVLTLGLGFYDPDPAEGFGIRLEDLAYLDDTGAESLTPLLESLDPRSWG